jgi:hypothetical protein
MRDHLAKPCWQNRHCLFVFLPVEEIDERSHHGLDGDILLRTKSVATMLPIPSRRSV